MSRADQQRCFKLLQLPETALEVVLQQLDTCSLASTVAACSKLRYGFLYNLSGVEQRCSSQEVLDSFILKLQQHSSSTPKLTSCSIRDDRTDSVIPCQISLTCLPCPQLQQLKLRDLLVQLEASQDSPGVLQDCTCLTALHLEGCQLTSEPAALAAIAALPQLQHLSIQSPYLSVEQGDERCMSGAIFPAFQHPQNLTYLSLDYGQAVSEPIQQLEHLSALVNLQYLQLWELPGNGYPGGWPSQLSKLTCLRVLYNANEECDVAKQFQHLSCLTALQDLAVSCGPQGSHRGIPGLQHLSQLTQLELSGTTPKPWEFSSSIISTWACRTVLHSLDLSFCTVQLEALAALTQLQALHLHAVTPMAAAAAAGTQPGPEELLQAVASLSQLTKLRCSFRDFRGGHELRTWPSGASYTALTASTNLRSLHINANGCKTPCDMVLFQAGTVYPRLRTVVIENVTRSLNQQQLQVLCSCCPALECLDFELCTSSALEPSPLQPLLQLSALTQLTVDHVGQSAAAVVQVAAQLTGLHRLWLHGFPALADPLLLQLTALTALEHLFLSNKGSPYKRFWAQARGWHHPSVPTQLLESFNQNEVKQPAATY